MSIHGIIFSPWGLQSARPLQPLTQILSDPITQTNTPSEACCVPSHCFSQWTWWVGRCDMQSRSFDICLTVNSGTLHNAVCAALPPQCFLPAQWRCHTGTCGKLQPHSQPPEPLENTGGNPSLIKKTQYLPFPWLLWSALLWAPPACDDNESRKEGNDFVSD